VASANVQLLGRLYEAFNGPDPLAVREFLADDFEYVNPPHAVEGGVRRGHEGFAEVVGSLDTAFQTWSHEPGEFLEADDKVVCFTTFKARGRDSAVGYEIVEPHVWTLRDGKAVRLEWFHDRDEAMAAAGLEPR
jgi:ketosteroid isomerase-like protein